MENPVWNQVLAEFEARRVRNEQESDRRLREITRSHPDLSALLERRHEMVIGAVRSAFAGGAEQDPEAAMEAFNREIGGLLERYGYPRDYLAPVCQCKRCGDTGFIYENSLQKQCDCLKLAYQQALRQSGGSEAEKQTFLNFDETRFPNLPLGSTDVTQRERMCAVRDKCRQYAENAGSGPVKTLLLHGGSGLGKTYLLHCVENEAKSRGVETVSVSAYDLLMALKNAAFSRGGETADLYFDAPLLLIDDLGMEPLMENITVEQIYNLLSSRLNRGLYTVITTNLSLGELQQRYTERVTSRLLDKRSGIAIQFVGKDIRLVKA